MTTGVGKMQLKTNPKKNKNEQFKMISIHIQDKCTFVWGKQIGNFTVQ